MPFGELKGWGAVTPAWLLGVDCGTTMTKVALFDLEGSMAGVESTPRGSDWPLDAPPQEPLESLWHSVCCSIRVLLERCSVDPSRIVGVACTGHGNGLYALDSRAQAVCAPITATDLRAAPLIGDLDAHDRKRLHDSTWQGPWAGQPALLLSWLRDHDSTAFAHIRHVMLCKDYVNLRLTGAAGTDDTDLSTAGLLALPDRRFATTVADVFNLPELESWLPPVSRPTDLIGRVTDEASSQTGLRSGTPVAAGAVDIVASAIGAGAAASGQTSIIAGTWSINGVVTRDPLVDDSLAMTTTFTDSLWYAVDSSAASATNLEWFVGNIWTPDGPEPSEPDASMFDLCINEAAWRPPELADPLYVPYLHGSLRNPAATAGLFGLRQRHTRPDLTRAVLEGVAFGHREHLERLWALGAPRGPVSLAGGVARNRYWTQLFADVLQVPVSVSDTVVPGTRGAALLAGIATGHFEDAQQAADLCVRISRTHVPLPDRAAVSEDRYHSFRQIGSALEPLDIDST